MAKQKWWQRQNKSKKNKQSKAGKALKQPQRVNKPKGKNMSDETKVTPIAAGKVLSDEEFETLKSQHDTGGAFKAQTAARQGCWDAGIEILPNCGHMKVPAYHIEFELMAHQKINKLKASYPSLEWLAYLVGTVDHEANKVTVEDLVIPDSQQVTGVSVYNVEYEWGTLPDGKVICGVIHSHHSMGAFFSGTDDAYINQNHDVSIVVATARGREIKAQVRVKTPCNAYVLAEDITYSVKYPQVLDEDAFEAEFKTKINNYVPPVVQYVNYGTNYLGNSSRGYSNHRGINSYGGRGASNPPRGSQTDLYEGYDTVDLDLLDELDDQYPDPFKMSDLDLRDHLMDYYTEEEVEEFLINGEAAEELNMVQNLCKDGYTVNRSTLAWMAGEDEVDPLDTNAQNGASQVATGVALRDQTNDDSSIWSTTDDEEDQLVFDLDEVEISEDPVYIRVTAQLEEEGLFKNMTDVEKHNLVVEAMGETEAHVASN